MACEGEPPADEADFPALGSYDDERPGWQSELANEVKMALSAVKTAERGIEGRLSLEAMTEVLTNAAVPSDVSDELLRLHQRTPFAIPSIRPFPSPRPWERSERIAAIDLRDELTAQANALAVQVSLKKAHLDRIARPKGVGWGIFALLGFSVVGIAFPLSLLAIVPPPSGLLPALGVIVGFIVGLGGVIWFMYYQLASLKKPGDQESLST